MTSLAALLFDGLLAPDDVAVHDADGAMTRHQVEAEADALALALAEAGVPSGAPVAVRLGNRASLVGALFGAWRHGSVYVPVNPRLTVGEVERIITSVRPAALVERAADRFAVQRIAGSPAKHDSDVALIQFTSGTTGRPKPVLLRHSGVGSLLDGVVGVLRQPPTGSERRPAMPNLVPVSLSLWAGIYQVLFAFRVGAPVVIMDHFDTADFAALIARFAIRSTVLPPAAMAMLSDDPSITSLAPLKYVRSISAPLSPLQARRFKQRFGITVMNGYGQTELGGEIVGWTAADAKEFGDTKLGAVGRPHPGVSVRIVGDGEAGPDEAGELWVRTPALVAGYADGGDLSDRMSSDGWFRTGDIARVDGDGFVWIEGRVSDMINRGGLKVFPEEVAEVIRLHPSVSDAAVAGVADDRLGEVPWAFVVPAGGETVDRDGIVSLCREHLAPYKVPAGIDVVAELPRNEIGKVVAAALDRNR